MDRVVENLLTIVREEVEDYAQLPAYKATSYFFESANKNAFAWVAVPDKDYPVPIEVDVLMMARVEGQCVIIEKDLGDKPLYKELLRRGIPRENIVLAYAGESLSEESGDDS